MSRFVVMDVVFYGGSLNYDQGAGNYQELKKITKWDGRQYTLVSRYALRYSILEMAKMMGLWNIADGGKLVESGGGDKQVIQPKPELLLNGEILKYPEFDLFGYLITSTIPQASRVAPVKISHAISLTPFYYDNQFAGNIGFAKRRLAYTGKMDINLFTIEEHYTYYVYTVVIDLDKIGENEVYLSARDKDWEIIEFTDNSNEYILKLKGKKAKNAGLIKDEKGGELKIPRKLEIGKIEVDGKEKLVYVETRIEEIKDGSTTKVYKIIQKITPKEAKQKRIKELVKTILNLKRSIKGRDEDLSPKLLVVGIYKNHPYKTYKDKIFLKDEYSEESYDEIEEKEEDGKKIVKVKHIISKSKKPVFEVVGDEFESEPTEMSEDEIIEFISELFKDGEKTGQNINEGEAKNEVCNEVCMVKVFYDPSVKIEVKEVKTETK